MHRSSNRKRRTSSRRRRLPDPGRARRALCGLAIVVAAVLVAASAASASASAKTRVTVIGDSITASLDYVPAARQHLGKGFDLRADAVVCRRLVAASCAFQGSSPATALETIAARGRSLGPVVVINVGYNDWAAVYDVDRIMQALESAGVHTAIWVTLREKTPNYAQSNARIRKAARRWTESLVVADWNAYSRSKPWFRDDGLHLTASGAMGLARFLRPLVLAGTASS
jgi:lysophospholipase L1-like esterase